MKIFFRWLVILMISLQFSCKNQQENTLFSLVKDSGINFENNVVDNKQDNSFIFRNFYNGGGAGIGDINNDGLPEIFLSSNSGENKLYLNKGNFKFEDISVKAKILPDDKWYTGVVFADINHDGWLDIYVCSSGHMRTGNRKNKLYINNHDLTFTESAASYGLDISAYTTQVSFFDYDLDGDLDCFMINNSPIPVNQLNYSNNRDLPEKEWNVGEFLKGGGDHLYRNDNGKFIEVTRESGIHGSLISFGLGVSVGDINGDGYPDVYISNDSYERDYLYINQRNGTFKDEFEQLIQHTSMSSMGADVADINNDGFPDIFTTDMLPEDDYRLKTLGAFDNVDLYLGKEKAGFYRQFMQNCLQVNNKKGKFLETANYSGVDATDWSWGALMFDADNDGLNDIYVCNGVNRDVTNLDFMDFFANEIIQKMVLTGKKDEIDQVLQKIPINPMPNKTYRNIGSLKFSDVGNEWGLAQPGFSNGAAYGDLDNDGDIDLIVNNENQPAFVYRNNSNEINKNNYLAFLLKGRGENTFAIGSKINVYSGNEIICRELVPSRGFQSSMDYKIVIGLGKRTLIDSVTITWPDRSISKLENFTLNNLILIDESVQQKSNPVTSDSTGVSSDLYLGSLNSKFDKHQEDDFVDFYYERNIPELLSKEGPEAATGDVNGDGLDDIYICGATNQPGQLYFQTTGGGFVKKEEKVFNDFASFEDVASVFFDSDGDKDLDLAICPGGNNIDLNSKEIQLRLYKNDGNGNFSIDASAFPNNNSNISVAIANDFDHDGDQDLFIGGRSVLHQYGLTPVSFVLVNDGKGHFTDMAHDNNSDISEIGLVTDAVWVDIAGDSSEELVITGQWMAPRIFSFNGKKFVEVKSNLESMKGWWQSISAADLNGDGKKDLVLGNIGENFYLHPDKDHPVKLWINDFNQTGGIDKILTRTVDGKDVPVFLKHEMQDQVPSIKKGNLKHHEYAKKTMQELFTPALISKSLVKEFNYSSSCIAINNGNGNFTVSEMPFMAQLSSVNAIQCIDINADGFLDLVMAGNKSGFLPQFGRLDASFGHVMINNGKAEFKAVEPNRSGLELVGEVRDIKLINSNKGNNLLFLRNNDYPALYSISNSKQINVKP